MPKVTLLDLVQRILMPTGGDPVNSIHDTIEAEQIAQVVRSCYRDMAAELTLGHQGELQCLEHVATEELPTLLKIPDMVHQIEFINYGVGVEEEPGILNAGDGKVWDGGIYIGYAHDDYGFDEGLGFGSYENVTLPEGYTLLLLGTNIGDDDLYLVIGHAADYPTDSDLESVTIDGTVFPYATSSISSGERNGYFVTIWTWAHDEALITGLTYELEIAFNG